MKKHEALACRVTGYRKYSVGKPCEDATRVIRVKGATIAAVADGHGDRNCIFAHVGSALAVRAACDVLKVYSRKKGDTEPSAFWNQRRKEIAQSLVKRFAGLVVSDYAIRCKEQADATEIELIKKYICELYTQSKEVYTPEQIRQIYASKIRLGERLQEILYLYGTTVRASLIAESYMFHLALGDGDTIMLINGNVEWGLPKSAAYECETASLCEDPTDVIADFVFSFTEIGEKNKENNKIEDTKISPQMLILSTDGLRNSFFSEQMFCDKIRNIREFITGKNNPKTALRRLKKLYEKLSMESVFQDDISSVFVWQI